MLSLVPVCMFHYEVLNFTRSLVRSECSSNHYRQECTGEIDNTKPEVNLNKRNVVELLIS